MADNQSSEVKEDSSAILGVKDSSETSEDKTPEELSVFTGSGGVELEPCTGTSITVDFNGSGGSEIGDKVVSSPKS